MQGENQVVQYSIIVADGDQNASQYLSGTLKANGFNAASTTSGLEVIGLYKSVSPDLVVTDLALEEMDGMTVLEELKKFDPAAKVIMITDNADKNMITRAFRMGVLDVLEKPIDPEFLISKIRDLLTREDRALEGNLQDDEFGQHHPDQLRRTKSSSIDPQSPRKGRDHFLQ